MAGSSQSPSMTIEAIKKSSPYFYNFEQLELSLGCSWCGTSKR